MEASKLPQTSGLLKQGCRIGLDSKSVCKASQWSTPCQGRQSKARPRNLTSCLQPLETELRRARASAVFSTGFCGRGACFEGPHALASEAHRALRIWLQGCEVFFELSRHSEQAHGLYLMSFG